MLTLEGKRALVTGGSRGIGRAICTHFGLFGARVAINHVRDEAAARTVAEVQWAGGDAFAVRADVRAPRRGRPPGRTWCDSRPRHPRRHHGIWKPAPIDSMTPAQWSETLQTNLGGAYAVCHHAARAMISQGSGAIVTIASTAGQRGEAGYSHYAASKGALLAFTKSLAAELAPHGIRVNAVSPGWVLSDMTRHIFDDPVARASALRPIPLGRPGTPEEIAGPVAFLASDLASFVYGEVLCVNGGAVMAG